MPRNWQEETVREWPAVVKPFYLGIQSAQFAKVFGVVG